MAEESRSRLGRGLASLIGDVGGETAQPERPRNQRNVPIEFLKPNPRNPRRTFSDAELGELASLDPQHGVIQPIVVRPVKGAQDRYEIIAGERRWRAAQRAGLHDVPIVPIEVSDSRRARDHDHRERAARQTSTRWKRRSGYHALADEFKHSQEDIAKDRRQEPQPRRQHDAADETAGGGAGLISDGKDVGRPRPRADRRARSAGARRSASSRKVSTSARPRRWRMKRACRSASRRRRGRGGGGKVKDADTIALEKRRQRCARSCRDRQPPRPRRLRPDQLPQSRTARRGDAAAARLSGKRCFAILSTRSATVIACPRARRGESYPRRFAFTAIESSVRCAMADASDRLLAHVERGGGELIDDPGQPRRAEIAQRDFDGALAREMQPRIAALEHGRDRRAFGDRKRRFVQPRGLALRGAR